MRHSIIVCACIAGLLTTSCSTPQGPKETGGMVIGGVGGALLGAGIGGSGTGAVVGAGLGAVAGGFLGKEIGKSMDSHPD